MVPLESVREQLRDGWRLTRHEWSGTKAFWADQQTERFEQHAIDPLGEHLKRSLKSLDALIDAVNAAKRDLP